MLQVQKCWWGILCLPVGWSYWGQGFGTSSTAEPHRASPCCGRHLFYSLMHNWKLTVICSFSVFSVISWRVFPPAGLGVRSRIPEDVYKCVFVGMWWRRWGWWWGVLTDLLINPAVPRPECVLLWRFGHVPTGMLGLRPVWTSSCRWCAVCVCCLDPLLHSVCMLTSPFTLHHCPVDVLHASTSHPDPPTPAPPIISLAPTLPGMSWSHFSFLNRDTSV